MSFLFFCRNYRQTYKRRRQEPFESHPTINTMSSWGSSSSGGWGSSGWGNQHSEEQTDPNGQHNGSCIAEYSGWGRRGLMSNYYDSKCSGCQRDRSMSSWGSCNSSKGNKIIKGLALLGGAKILKKGIWD